MSPLLTLHSVSGVGQLVRKSYSTRDNFSSPLPRFRAASGPQHTYDQHFPAYHTNLPMSHHS